MKLEFFSTAMITALIVLLCGCGTQKYGDRGKGYQLIECNSIPDNFERNNCINKTNASYEKFKQEKKYGDNY